MLDRAVHGCSVPCEPPGEERLVTELLYTKSTKPHYKLQNGLQHSLCPEEYVRPVTSRELVHAYPLERQSIRAQASSQIFAHSLVVENSDIFHQETKNSVLPTLGFSLAVLILIVGQVAGIMKNKVKTPRPGGGTL